MSTGAKPLTDPNVKVPQAVLRSSAKAEALHAQQHGDPDPTPAPAPSPAPVASPPPPAPTKAPVVTHAGNDPVDWEHRYKSMEGRYNQSQNTNQHYAGQLADANNTIANLQAQLNQGRVAAPAAAPTPAAAPILSDKDVQDYGAEFLDVVGRKAAEVLGPQLAEIKQVVGNLAGQVKGVGQSVAQSDYEKMLSYLDENVQRWREINTMDQFLAWLRLQDPYSGAIRHELLKQAWSRNDGRRVANFFNGFIADEAALAQPTSGQQGNAGGEPQPTAKPSLTEFAAPGRAAAGPAPRSPEKPLIKRSEIASFYTEVAAGKFKGRDAEKARREQEIFDAQNNGRVING